MIKLYRKLISTAVAGAAITGAGFATALAYSSPDDQGKAAVSSGAQDVTTARDDVPEQGPGRTLGFVPKKAEKKKADLPAGVSTATSFWDPSTASGKPMSYETLASPYWPLGTKVKVTYGDKSTIGVVEDFGPAEWAVAQHNPPAIIDLSEKMMQSLTGVRSNSVKIKFDVLELGHGRTYRDSGTGYDMATGMSDK